MFMQHHNDTIIKTDAGRKTQEDFLEKYLPLTLLQAFEKVVWGFTVRGSWRPNINCNNLTPHSYGRRVVSFLFPWCSTGGLGAHSAGWSATSYQQLLRSPNSIGVSEGPLGRVWLSLPHVVSNCLELYLQQLHCPPGRRTQLEPEINSTGSSNSTGLYNRSTPTRSLKSNV